MPGITGLAGQTGDVYALPSMLDRLEPAVPFIRHEWADPAGRAALGRVSLGFLDSAPQPAENADRTKRTVLTGEINEYAVHRRRLEAAGRRFRSDSHAELLLLGFEFEGKAFLRGQEGPFAAAIWDSIAP